MEQKPLPPLDSIHIAKQVPDDLKIDATKFYDALHAEVGLTPPENGYPLESHQGAGTEIPEVSDQPATSDENPYHRLPKSTLKSGLLEGRADAKLLEEFASRTTYRLPELTEITQRLEESSLYSTDEKEQLHSLLLDKIYKETSRLSFEQVVTLLESGSLDTESASLIRSALERKLNSAIKKDGSTNPTPATPDLNITDLQESPAEISPQNTEQTQILPALHPNDSWHGDTVSEQIAEPIILPTEPEAQTERLSLGQNMAKMWEEFEASGYDIEFLRSKNAQLFDIVTTITKTIELDKANPLRDLEAPGVIQAIDLLETYLEEVYKLPDGKKLDATNAEYLVRALYELNSEKLRGASSLRPELHRTPDNSSGVNMQTPAHIQDDIVVGSFIPDLNDNDIVDDDTIDGDFDDNADIQPLDIQFTIEDDGITNKAMLNFVSSYPEETQVKLRSMTKDKLLEFYDLVHTASQPRIMKIGEVAAGALVSGAKSAVRRARETATNPTWLAPQTQAVEQQQKLRRIDREALLARVSPEARIILKDFTDELLASAVDSIEKSLQSGSTTSPIPKSAAEVKGVARRAATASAKAAIKTRQRNQTSRQ